MPVPLRFNPYYQDGDYSSALRISRAPKEYPFRALGDVATYAYRATYIVLLSRFTPTAAGTADPEDGTAKLLEESIPQIVGQNEQGVLATFIRRYGNVPPNQVSYGNLSLSVPSPANVGTAQNAQRVTGAGASANLGANYVFAGGLFVNAAAASAYPTVYNKRYGGGVTVTSANSGADTRLTFPAAHGLAGTELIAVHATAFLDAYYLFDATQYTVVDGTHIDLLGWNFGALATRFTKLIGSYTPGTKIIRTRLTQKFYEDGTTIPLPASLLSDADFLTAAIANASGYVGYATSSPVFWSNSYIYTTTSTELLFDDL